MPSARIGSQVAELPSTRKIQTSLVGVVELGLPPNRINERLIARGMDPMRGPCLTEVLQEATGERLTSRDALRLWDPERLAGDPRVRAVLRRYVERRV